MSLKNYLPIVKACSFEAAYLDSDAIDHFNAKHGDFFYVASVEVDGEFVVATLTSGALACIPADCVSKAFLKAWGIG